MREDFFILLIFIVIGYFVQKLISGKYEGEKIESSLRFLWGETIFHFHHWLIYSFILIILFLIDFYNPFIYGLLIGGGIQGLMYRDRFTIVYKKKNFNKIYKKLKKSKLS
ncbi:MAG: hypothetical protein NUV46_01715 [Nanoarchaeota archaeon]|nr:hypothetical protein [Nanoarchaeota archaeon]